MSTLGIKFVAGLVFFVTAVTGAVAFSENQGASHRLPTEQQQNDLSDKEREDSKKNRRIRWVLFNDNFGSSGNETGLTHGSRLTYSQGPADGKNWSVSLQSQLYISEDYSFVEKSNENALVHPVERNDIEFTQRIPLSNGKYVIVGASAGYTTNRAKHFIPGGSKDQQKVFHDLFKDEVGEYEYIDQDSCTEALNTFHDRLVQAEQTVRKGCEDGDENIVNQLQGNGFSCETVSGYLNLIRKSYENQLERSLEQCKGKTEFHLGSKVAFGNIYPLNADRNICRKSDSDLSCKAYLQMEGGLDLITVENDSTAYFFAKINQPLFPAGKGSALSAFARWGIRQQIFEGNSEQNRTLGLQWSFINSNIRLEVSQPNNSLGRLFDIPNDDDSIVYLSYELYL